MRCVIWGVLLGLVHAAAAMAGGPQRPNLVLLVADDLRWDCLSCSGHPLLKTPAIDRLAAEGLYFRKAFVTTSICAVSRASLMTGRYARNHGVPDFNTALPPSVLAESLPALLKRAGYRTACFGKWGLGGRPPTELFDAWDAWGGQGDYFLPLDGQRLHNSEYLARRAIEFLSRQAAGQPYFLLVYFKAPHDPMQPDPVDQALFAGQQVPRPRTATEAHFNALPAFIQRSEGRTRALNLHPTPDAWQEFARQYLRLVAGLDRAVGKILDELDARGQAGNTVVAFSSDNGFFLGERGLSHKWLMHEESIRVPLIIRDPRLPAARRGVRAVQMALNIDLAPTLLAMAGVPVPQSMDGKDLSGVLSGSDAPLRDDFFYEHHFHFNGKIPRTEGVRQRDWKYITYYDVVPPHEELYDLANDPFEERNLAALPDYRPRLEALRALYQQYLARLGPPLLPAGPPPPAGQ
jgi:arylsulfatase A-like enzyme